MSTNKKQIIVRFQPNSYEKIKVLAAENTRSMTNMVEYMVESYIKQYEEKNGQIAPINNNVKINKGNINNSVTMING